ncbi:MAG TPA: GntR family transcriptional regulator [Trueperaceae bacterium]
MKQITFTPMFEMVLDSIRQAITSGAWQAGELLSHEELANRLQVSRMPVREAVRLLEQEGFVTIRRNVGIEVLPLSWDDFEEIYLMRQALESLAGRLAAPLLGDADLAYMNELLEGMAVLLDEGAHETSATLKLTQQFHSTLYAPCGKKKLLKTIDTLRHHSTRYRAFVVQLPGREQELLKEHSGIYQACLSHDPDEVASRLHEHFGKALALAAAQKDVLEVALP